MTNRHFLKCSFCERPMSVNVEKPEELQFILTQACPLCGELALRYMGKVQNTNLVKTGVKSACDLRCTNAVGPKCDCPCENANHGTHRLVVFDKIVGKLEVVEKDLLNNNEAYLARIKRMAAAKNSIKVKVITFLTYQNRKVIDWVNVKKQPYWRLAYEEQQAYAKYQQFLKKIDKIEDLQSIQKKINSITHLIPQIGTTLDYLEALSAKKEEVPA
jgi:hypothetical protein